VTIRPLDEILATLDADSKLDGLPFMPEMIPYCGKTFRVFRRAEKTCIEGLGIRTLQSRKNKREMVFLEGLRCDGSAHDGCQRGCLFFWNEAWLRKANDECGMLNDECSDNKESAIHHSSFIIHHSSQLPTTKGDRYYCQSTELAGASEEWTTGKLRTYLHDIRIGELTVSRFLFAVRMALANRLWKLLYGRGFYQITGEQKKTVREELNLQPGELVEIKSAAEIQVTLDDRGRNRGLSFEPEMALHCGRRYRVGTPLRKIIAEETGKMVELSNTVILDGLVCEGICTMNCPRANYLYWREIWLKRV
jgi:hypothetical protein